MNEQNDLEQTKVWIDQKGVAHDIETMDPDHRANLLPYILRRAAQFQGVALYRLHMAWPVDASEQVEMMFEEEEMRLTQQPAEEWILDRPLVKRLRVIEAQRGYIEKLRTVTHNKTYWIRKKAGRT